MSTSRYYASDEDEGHGHPNLSPYTMATSQNFRPEPIANGSHSSSITKVSNDYRGPVEASSDYPNGRPLPNVMEQPQHASYPVYPVESRGMQRPRDEVQAYEKVEMSTVRKDDMFYMKSLFLRVEGKPFSVPRSSLEPKSALITDMLSTSSDTGPGSSSSNPLVLIGMTAGEFGHFLDALSEEIDEELQQEQWIDVLKVSFLLKADDVHKTAITHLDNSLPGPVTRVELATKYNVPKWRTTGYQALAIAADALDVEEAERIGWENALKISRIRDTRLLKRISIVHESPERYTSSCSRSQFHEKLFPASPPKNLRREMYEAFVSVFGPSDGPVELVDGESTPDTESPGPAKWKKLYNTSFAVFKVEDNLFRVPQHIFTEPSSTFTTMYTLPPEGEEDNNPVVLRDVNADDFRAFLKCALKTFSDEEGNEVWLSAIKVSELWHLTRVRSFAVSKLEQGEPDLAARIALSLSHNIPEWFRPNMLNLALRRKAPEKREADQIGWANIIRLFQLREKLCPLRKQIVEAAMLNAGRSATSNTHAAALIYTCPMCKQRIVNWEWVSKVDDKAEAQDAKRAISDAFPPDGADSKPTRRVGRGVDTQPSRRSPPSSIRRGVAPVPVNTYSRPSRSCGDCFSDCCECCCDCCSDVCCCCC